MDPKNVDNMQLCRLCGQITEDPIEIFGGTVDNLPEKINEYLPIKISVTDNLPLTSCITCTNTLLSFDQLVTTCLKADKYFEKGQSTINQELEDQVIGIDNGEDPINIENGTPSNDKGRNHVDGDQEGVFDGLHIEDTKTFCSDNNLLLGDKSHTECHTLSPHLRLVLSSEREFKHKAKQNKNNTKKDYKDIKQAQEVIDGKIYYKCKHCHKLLHSLYTYKSHIKIHTGERPYVCDFCGKQFRIQQGLQRHIRETHVGIKNFPCDLCARKFATKQSADEHRNIHTNERPYICDLCGKAFKQKASLFVHNRSHSNVLPFSCEYCEHAFRTKTLLARHITKHTGEKPHACDVCGRTFRIKNEMTRHKLVHSDLKPFKCRLCGLEFRMKRYLKTHLKTIHHSDKR